MTENKKEKLCPLKKGALWMQEKARQVNPEFKKHKGIFIGGVCVLILIGLWASMSGSGSVVGVVDVMQVREKAAVYQGILSSQKKYEEEWRIRFNAEKDLLTQEDKALADKRSKTKAAVFKKEVDAFQKKVIAFQQKYQEQYTQIIMASQMAVQQADQMALETIRQLGKKKGVDVIMPMQAALYSSDRVDLTEDFIRLFDDEEFWVQYTDPKSIQVPAQK